MKRLNYLKKLQLPLLFCLTLGLAPYTPEPHIVGKLRWVMGGANGMQAMDWFDFFLHGFPWVYFVVVLAKGLSTSRFTSLFCFFWFALCMWINF
jgi:hypothetical protein